MRSTLAVLLLAALPAPAAAADPVVTPVDLSNFSFAPAALQLRAGVPTLLRLSNSSGGGHNFTAPAFFAAARIDPRSAALVRKGRVEVPRKSTVEVLLTPAAGSYPLRCTHTLHATFGMKGSITVR